MPALQVRENWVPDDPSANRGLRRQPARKKKIHNKVIHGSFSHVDNGWTGSNRTFGELNISVSIASEAGPGNCGVD
jgi:hypothetical protein